MIPALDRAILDQDADTAETHEMLSDYLDQWRAILEDWRDPKPDAVCHLMDKLSNLAFEQRKLCNELRW